MKAPAFSLAPALFFSVPCLAAEVPAPALSSASANLWQMFFGLAFVFGILGFCVWLLKRFSSPVRGNGLLRILGAAALGPREKVVLLEAGEKILMLGVAPGNVRTLHVFSRDELPLPEAAPIVPGGSALAASFASRLAQALKGRRNAGSDAS